jgi:Ca2+-binding RTX toxin-like protein
VIGTGADEMVTAPGGSGIDIAAGGGGGDIFIFIDRPGTRDIMRITDFDVGPGPDADAIDLGDAALGLTRTLGTTTYLLLDGADRDMIVLSGVDAVNAALIDFI